MSTEPRPPTLEELIKILRVAKHFRITSMEGTSESDLIKVSFTISKEDCVEHDIHVRTFGSLFLAELVESLDKLYHFENVTQQFRSPDEKGATAADCVHFLNNELRHVAPGSLEGTLRRRFYTTIIKKLTELQEWRAFVDRDRFEELRKRSNEERKRREEAERKKRKYEEDVKAGKAGPGKGSYSGNPFEEAARNAHNHFYDEFRSAFEQAWNEDFRNAFYGNNRQKQQEKDETFTWGNGKKPWHEILGVHAGATKSQIKKAWRILAKQYHPDRNKEPGASDKMAEINAAKDEGLAACSA